MRIFHKLLLGNLIIVFLTGVVGLIGVQGLKDVRERFLNVANDSLPESQALEDLRSAALRIVSSTNEFAFIAAKGLADPGEASQLAKEEELLSEGKAAFQNALAACSPFMQKEPEELAMLAKIEASGVRLHTASKAFVMACKQRSSTANLLVAKERFEEAEEEFLAIVKIALDWERGEIDVSRKLINQVLSLTLTKIGTVTLLTILLAFGCSAVVAALFSRRIRSLDHGLQRISRGELETRLANGSRDELGNLAVSFNLMAGELCRSEEELVSTSLYLDRIINSVVDSLVVVAADGTIRTVNPATCTLLGYEKEELIGQQFATLFVEITQWDELLRTLDSGLQVNGIETSYRTRDGQLIPVSFSASNMEIPTIDRHDMVCIAHDISRRKKAEHAIKHLAFYDQLTGLPNRTLFADRLNQAMAAAERERRQLAVLFFDLDRFKNVNDTMGHASGDLLLQLVAQRFATFVRKSDTLARLGGDEFVLLCTGIHHEQDAGTVAEKIAKLFALPFDLEGHEVHVTTSIGIVFFPNDGDDASTLLKNADLAMYAAKESGRNAYQFFSEEMNRKVHERNYLENGLRRAQGSDQLFLHFQPQIDMQSGRIYGVEALLRWRHPDSGLIPPDRFIPIAEQVGLIRQLGKWVLDTACSQARQWIDAGYSPITVAVNVSGMQLLDQDFPDQVALTLQESGLDPTQLELEITESVLMVNPKEVAQVLKRLKKLNVQLAVDDFGTGYSSLSYLMEFPLDRLKIDKLFIRNISHNSDRAIIVNTIIALGHDLGLRVLAEGVETEAEQEYLLAHGCDEVQGYLYARPMAATAITELLDAGTAED